MRPIDEAIIHCSATRPGWMYGEKTSAKVAEIRRWHVDGNGWSDIGYHYIIDRDGTVAQGRPVERAGAHTKGHNARSIGVCLIGGHGAAATDDFSDHFTVDQAKALDRLLDSLKVRFGPVKVSGHNQYANKGCPGFDVPTYFSDRVAIDVPIATPEPKASPWAGFFKAILSIFKK